VAKAFPLFAVNPAGKFAGDAPLMLHTRLAELYRFAPYIHDPVRVSELHDMRIAAKRLRYTMEIFAPCFPETDFAGLYDSIKSVQEQIGDIHDCDVRVPLLQQFLSAHAHRRPEIRIGIENAITTELAKRRRLYEKFRRYWSKLDANHFRREFLELLIRSQEE
jgi:CHAD domain-containing protein